MKITTEYLRSLDACADQVERFAAEWPEGVELSRSALLRAAELSLDLNWFARAVLSPGKLAEYDHAFAPAWAEYERAVAPALADALGLPAETI